VRCALACFDFTGGVEEASVTHVAPSQLWFYFDFLLDPDGLQNLALPLRVART
jgi:hypothetical protein